jgi:hypothetical protein
MQDTAVSLTAEPSPSIAAACSACGTWVCDDCGAHLGDASRFSSKPHRCPKCESPNGQMVRVVHRARRAEDHRESFLRVVADGVPLRYPLAATA